MKRYLSLYLNFFKNCLVREFEFRFNLTLWTVMDFVFLGMIFLTFELIFGQVTTIAGWDRDRVLILVLTTALFNDFFWTFIHLNLMFFSDLVRKGNLDFVLLKPVNSRFLVSTRYFEFDHFLRMPFLVFLINRQVLALGFRPTMFSWLGYFALFFLGLFVIYNFFFIITTCNFWFIRIFNLSNLFEDIINVSRYPVDIFKKKTKFFLVYFIPTVFISFFPSQFLIGGQGYGLIILAMLAGTLLFYFSQAFWSFALKHYQSASS